MGNSQGTFIDYREPPNAPSHYLPLYTSSSLVTDHHYCDYNDHIIKTLVKKMFREFGLSCFLPPPHKKSNQKTPVDDGSNNNKKKKLEHNKAWLLVESSGCVAELENADPHSVNSFFKLTFCSQVELDSMNTSFSTVATVLMVNLGNGMSESKAKEVKLRRFESMERSISPMAYTLIRFSYSEILAATRNCYA
ncbi:hypothetical protein FF1_027883 [Malus domestica]